MDEIFVIRCLMILTLVLACHGQLRTPRITEHPVDVTVEKNKAATLNCKADGWPEPKITWYRGERGEVVTNSQHRMLLPTGSLFFLNVMHKKKEHNVGTYWCVATNSAGSARSHNATLHLAFLREDFRNTPSNQIIALGDAALLECIPPRGFPEPWVTWRKNGQQLDLEANRRLRLVDGGSLAIQDVRQSDEGRYQCVAKNMAGSFETVAAMLTVHQRPYFMRPPQDVVALAGQTVEFPCQVGGHPMPDVEWRRAGGNMPLERIHLLEDHTLRLMNVVPGDAVEYSCEADNAVGRVTASAHLTVHSPPNFSKRPSDQRVEVHQDATFSCVAWGSPEPLVFWTLEGNRTLLFPGTSLGRFSVNKEGVLRLADSERADSGLVARCAAVNEAGAADARASLRVTSKLDLPPPIIRRGPSNQTLPLGSSVDLPCEAAGSPRPVITWYKGVKPVSGSSSRASVSDTGTLHIDDLQPSDSGSYTCVASSNSGKSTWSASLRLASPSSDDVIFFRSPELSTLPGAPGRPHVVSRTSTSATLTWARSTKIGSSSLLGYQVEYFARDPNQQVPLLGQARGWVLAAQRVSDTTFTQHHLRPGVTYVFIVRAENSHGLSLPSEPSEAATTLEMGRDVESLGDPLSSGAWDMEEARAKLGEPVVELSYAQAISATQVKLTWELVLYFSINHWYHDNSDDWCTQILSGEYLYVEGFYIYSRGGPGGAWAVQTVLQAGASGFFVVSELRPATSYNFFLVPFYRTVEGRPSNSRNAVTFEDAPSEPPTQLEAVLINSTAVFFKWQPPAPLGHNGELIGYRVLVFSNHSLLANLTVPAVETSVLIGDLQPGEMYAVQAAAFTKAGQGPLSPPATLRVDATRLRMLEGRVLAVEPGLGDLTSEPWFLALAGSMLAVMVVLFAITLLVRRAQLVKKTHLGVATNEPRASASLTPLSGKAAPPDSLWIDSRWRPGDSVTALKSTQSTEVERRDTEGEDYAEVGSRGALSSFQPPSSPAPYASTTLVSGSRLMTRRSSGNTNGGYSAVSQVPSEHSKQPTYAQGWVQLCMAPPPVSRPPTNDACSQNGYSDLVTSCGPQGGQGRDTGGYSDTYITGRHVQYYATPRFVRGTGSEYTSSVTRPQPGCRRNMSAGNAEQFEFFSPPSAPGSSVLPRRSPRNHSARTQITSRYTPEQPQQEDPDFTRPPPPPPPLLLSGYASSLAVSGPRPPPPQPPPYSRSDHYQSVYAQGNSQGGQQSRHNSNGPSSLRSQTSSTNGSSPPRSQQIPNGAPSMRVGAPAGRHSLSELQQAAAAGGGISSNGKD